MMVGIFCPRQVCQKHCHYHERNQDHALGPRLLGELLAACLQVDYTFVPGIYRYQFHVFFLILFGAQK